VILERSVRRSTGGFVAVLATAVLVAATGPESVPVNPASALVVFGSEEDADTIVAEVAQTDAERAQGLMNREELGEDAGMLFVLPNYEEISFWMKDTYIPLDIAFMDPSFRITGIARMEPQSEELVDSPGRIQFALEVNQGWFEEHGVKVGDTPRIYFTN